MTKSRDYIARPRDDDTWETIRTDADGPAGVFCTQFEAWEYARVLAGLSRGYAYLEGPKGKRLKEKKPSYLMPVSPLEKLFL